MTQTPTPDEPSKKDDSDDHDDDDEDDEDDDDDGDDGDDGDDDDDDGDDDDDDDDDVVVEALPREWPLTISNGLPDTACAASVLAPLWPPALSQEHARQQLFEMITVKGVNGNYHIAIEDVPAFVQLLHTFVHPSVRSKVEGFTVERVRANVQYLNQ